MIEGKSKPSRQGNLSARFSILIFLSLLIGIETALADFSFSPTIYYYEYRSRDSNETVGGSTASRSLKVDFRLGYAFAEGYYLGAIYGLEDTTAGEGDWATKTTAAHYGPSIGIVMGSFNLIGHYLMKADRIEKPLAQWEKRYSDGTGYQIDIGWTFLVSPTFGLGPQITWASFTYKRRTETSGGVTTEGSQSYNINKIYPRIAFWFVF